MLVADPRPWWRCREDDRTSCFRSGVDYSRRNLSLRLTGGHQGSGANWFPSALWTIISLLGFAISLVWLDRIEQREKRLARVVVEQPEDLAVPIAQ